MGWSGHMLGWGAEAGQQGGHRLGASVRAVSPGLAGAFILGDLLLAQGAGVRPRAICPVIAVASWTSCPSPP